MKKKAEEVAAVEVVVDTEAGVEGRKKSKTSRLTTKAIEVNRSGKECSSAKAEDNEVKAEIKETKQKNSKQKKSGEVRRRCIWGALVFVVIFFDL